MEQIPTTDELLSQIDDCIDDCIDGVKTLKAENAALRKALEAVKEYRLYPGPLVERICDVCKDAISWPEHSVDPICLDCVINAALAKPE